MSRIATLAAVLTMIVAPAALARPAQQPNINDIGKQAAPALVDLRSPDAASPVQVAGQDLRSPDARDVFSPAVRDVVAPAAEPSSPDVSTWGLIGLIAAGLAASGALFTLVRHHRHVGGTLGA
jgi:hypothetical protein